MPHKLAPIFHIYDADQSIRKTAARIGKRNGIGGTTGAIRYAVKFTEAAQKSEPAPLDYNACTDEELSTLAVHGSTWLIRRAALDTIMNRIGQAYAAAKRAAEEQKA